MNEPDEPITPEDKDLRDSLFTAFLIGFVDERRSQKRSEVLGFIMSCLSAEQKAVIRTMLSTKKEEQEEMPADPVEESRALTEVTLDSGVRKTQTYF